MKTIIRLQDQALLDVRGGLVVANRRCQYSPEVRVVVSGIGRSFSGFGGSYSYDGISYFWGEEYYGFGGRYRAQPSALASA